MYGARPPVKLFTEADPLVPPLQFTLVIPMTADIDPGWFTFTEQLVVHPPASVITTL